MSTIVVGEIDLCACTDAVDVHDAYGCSSEGCGCVRTPDQLHAVSAIRDSLSLLTLAR